MSLVVAGALVRAHAGAFVPMATALRVTGAIALCFALGFVMPRFGRLATPGVALFVAAAYIALLVVTREVGRGDLAMVLALRSKPS